MVYRATPGSEAFRYDVKRMGPRKQERYPELWGGPQLLVGC